MAKMNWTKPSAETVAYFERIAPGPPIQARRMFGMPSRFLNGHMLVSVFGDAFMLRLSETDREECIAAGARPFAPMGRMAKEYVEIVPGHFPDQMLKEWIARGMRYLGSLPPKLEAMREAPRSTGPKTMRGAAIAAKSKAPAAVAKPKKKAKTKVAVKPKAKAKTKVAVKRKAEAKTKTKTNAKAKKPVRAAAKRAVPAKKKRAAKKAPARRGRR